MLQNNSSHSTQNRVKREKQILPRWDSNPQTAFAISILSLYHKGFTVELEQHRVAPNDRRRFSRIDADPRDPGVRREFGDSARRLGSDTSLLWTRGLGLLIALVCVGLHVARHATRSGVPGTWPFTSYIPLNSTHSTRSHRPFFSVFSLCPGYEPGVLTREIYRHQ